MFYKKFSISLENLVGKVENLSEYPLYEKAKNLFKGVLYSLEVKWLVYITAAVSFDPNMKTPFWGKYMMQFF